MDKLIISGNRGMVPAYSLDGRPMENMNKLFTLNLSEQKFIELTQLNGLDLMKRGFPDFMIIKDGEIIGFVEVKPFGKELKKTQKMFAKFCEKNKIPFFQWNNGDQFPKELLEL